MRVPRASSLGAASVVFAVIPGTASGVGQCPTGNDPFCWDPVFTCRHCCDLSSGPSGDDSCWGGALSFSTCCDGDEQVVGYDPYTIERCTVLSAWMMTGLDSHDLTEAEHEENYKITRRMCPPVAAALSLTRLTPELVKTQLHAESGALYQAEGTLQWFLDMMIEMLSPGARTFSIFYTLHRVILQVAATRGEGHFAGRAVPVGSAGDWLRRAIDWGVPFDAAVVRNALDEAAVALGGFQNASVARSYRGQLEGGPLTVPLPCSLEAALALTAQADIVRLAEGIGAESFRSSVQLIQVCLDDVHRRQGWLLPQLLEGGVPLLAALDRLECDPDTEVLPSLPGSGEGFHGRMLHVSVLPNRDFESSHMRGWRDLHCANDIRSLLLERLQNANGSYVEVGAYLGGCTFWAALIGEGIQAVAFEPYGAAVAAFRSTIRRNGLGTRVRVERRCISHEVPSHALRRMMRTSRDGLVPQPAWEEVPPRLLGSASQWTVAAAPWNELVECSRLDDMLEDKPISVLRVHTIAGKEHTVLASAERLFQRGRVGAVVMHDTSLPVARFLWRHGFELQLADRRIPSNDPAGFEHMLRTTPNLHHAVLLGQKIS